LGLTKGAAVDYGHQHIRVNAILPGAVDTPMVQALTSDPQFADLLEKLRASHPVGRISSPEEIAAAAVWLLSDSRPSLQALNWPWTAASSPHDESGRFF
jgi:NAD(P)-dependent dehydrogenase (short-subunit alcohol dehydrogenase family)